MAGNGTTAGDWAWRVIGVAGVICIVIAAWMGIPALLGSEPPTPDELFVSGRGKLDKGDAKGAVADLEKAIQALAREQKVNPVFHSTLGNALASAGQEKEAVEQWLTSLRIHPTAPPCLGLAGFFEKQKDSVQALAFYRAALALHPDPVPGDLPGKVAAIYAEVEPALDASVDEVRKSLLANFANADALSTLLLARLAKTRVAEDAAPAAGLLAAVGGVASEAGDLAELLIRQESAVKDRPESVVDQSGLGNICLLRGEYDRATQVFEKALEISPGDGPAQFGVALADLLGGAKSFERIEKTALALRGNPNLLVALGAASLAAGDRDKAKTALLIAFRLNPALPEVYRLLAQAFTGDEEEKEREAALRAYRRLIGG